jgi:trans-2,3-dihydro-3-hydroxyanthranilate isomerase
MDSLCTPLKAIMTQQKPSFGSVVEVEDMMECLRLDRNDFMDGTPLQVVSTGVPFLMVPVIGMDILKNVQVDRSLFQSLLNRIGVDAAYMFCLDGFEQDADAHGRLLTSAVGSEDPFTGSAAGCMGAYIAKYGLRPGQIFKVEQGHLMGRPGTGMVEIIGPTDEIESIKVGGCAVKTLDGFIFTDN